MSLNSAYTMFNDTRSPILSKCGGGGGGGLFSDKAYKDYRNDIYDHNLRPILS